MPVLSSFKARGADESRNSGHLDLKQLKTPLSPSSGISCSINLLEPCVYLPGPDHHGYSDDDSNTEAVIRGVLLLELSKSIKIKSVKLSFCGRVHIANIGG